MMSKTITMDMTNGSIVKKLIKYSIPTVIMNLLQVLFGMTDVFVVGLFVSDQAVAAVGSNSSIVNLIIALFIGMSVASNVLVSKYIGRGESEKTTRVVGTSVLLSIVTGSCLAVFGFFMTKYFLMLVNCAESVIDLATLYLKIYFLGMPAVMLYNYCASILRATGDTFHPMLFISIAGAINVVLDIFFVAVLNMTVDGVAIATVIANVFSAVSLLFTLIKQQGPSALRKKYFRFYKDELRSLIKIGIPSGIQSSVFAISNIIIQSAINSFGDKFMTANTIAAQFDHIMYTIGDAIAVSVISFVSQNYGAGKDDRIKRTVFSAMGMVTIMGAMIYIFIIIFGRTLCGIFTNTEEIIELALIRLQWMSPMYIICSYMAIFSNTCKGLGRATTAMIISFVGSCLLRVLYIEFILPLNRTEIMLYLAYPISWAATCIIYLFVLIPLFKHLKQDMAKDKEKDLEAIKQERAKTA